MNAETLEIQKKSTRDISESELNLLIEKNKYIYTEYYDFAYLKSVIKNVTDFIDKYYFRSRFIGFENIPQRNNPDRPLIYASNHSGMAFPWDAMIFGAGVLKLNNFDTYNAIRGLAAPMLSQSPLMNPYLIPNLWKKAGGIDATTLNFETMMQYKDSNVLIYPEGVPGIGKGFNKRYQLQRFATSFIRMSLKYKTDVIPVSTVNAEYINPYSYNSNAINKIVNKIGIPFLPLGPSTLGILLQPWVFYCAFPANLTYVMGKRIKPYEMTDKPFDKIERSDLIRIAEIVKTQMQEELDEAVSKYGKKPYSFKELCSSTMKNLSKAFYFYPSGWPLLFLEHERLYNKSNGNPINIKKGFFSCIKMIFRNPRVLAFYLPIIGWIPIIWRIVRNRK